jgi:hypothetical protein
MCAPWRRTLATGSPDLFPENVIDTPREDSGREPDNWLVLLIQFYASSSLQARP